VTIVSSRYFEGWGGGGPCALFVVDMFVVNMNAAHGSASRGQCAAPSAPVLMVGLQTSARPTAAKLRREAFTRNTKPWDASTAAENIARGHTTVPPAPDVRSVGN
jgi:hypothetical protein